MVKRGLLVAGIATVGIGLAVFLILQKVKGDDVVREAYLTITAGPGGTTDPPPDTYAYSPGAIEIITAIPNADYYVEGWMVDGISQGATTAIPVNMTQDHTVTVTFTIIPPPPPEAVPTSIKNLTAPPPASLSIKQFIKGFWVSNDATRTQTYRVLPVSDWASFDLGATEQKTVEFQVWDDILNEPVPNIPCLIYTSYKDPAGGYPSFEGYYPITKPLRVVSNVNGKIIISFVYGIDYSEMNVLSQEHIAYARRYGLPGLFCVAGSIYKTEPFCLKDGDVFPYCNYLENGCCGEAIATTATSCPLCVPNCIDIGEHETLNAHIITCEMENNPALKAICSVNCRFGIAHIA